MNDVKYTRAIKLGNINIEYSLEPVNRSIHNILGPHLTVNLSHFGGNLKLTLHFPKTIDIYSVQKAFFQKDINQLYSFILTNFPARFELRDKLFFDQQNMIEGTIILDVKDKFHDKQLQYNFSARLLEETAIPKSLYPPTTPSLGLANQSPATRRVSTPSEIEKNRENVSLQTANERRPSLPLEPEKRTPAIMPDSWKQFADRFNERLNQLEHLLIQIDNKIGTKENQIHSLLSRVESLSSKSDWLKLKEIELRCYVNSLQSWFTQEAEKMIKKIKKTALAKVREYPAFTAFQRLIQNLEGGNPYIQQLELKHRNFKASIEQFRKTVQDTFAQVTTQNLSPHFNENAVPSFEDFMTSEYPELFRDWLTADVEPPSELLNPETVYRRAVFQQFRAEYEQIRRQADTYTISVQDLDMELNRIAHEQALQHIDQLENIELSVKNQATDLERNLDFYIEKILEPLGMKLIPLVRGQRFDPQCHDNKNPALGAGKTIQEIIKRGIQDLQDQIVRRPAVRA